MNGLLRSLFTVTYPYPNKIQRQRAQGVMAVLWASLLGWAGYVFGVALPRIAGGDAPELFLNAGFALVPFVSAFSIYLIQRGRLQLAAFLLVMAVCAATLPLLFTSPDGLLPLGVIVPLVAGGVLLRRSGFAVVVLLVIGGLVLRALWLGGDTAPYTIIPANNAGLLILVPLVAFGSAAAFLYAFSGSAERITSEALDEAQMMGAAATFGATLDPKADENAILNSMMHLLQEQFGFFNVQMYMQTDDGGLARRTRIAMGRDLSSTLQQRAAADSLVGSAASARRTLVADSSAAADVRALVAAPARKALALPVVADNKLIGVVEAQSDSATPFSAAQVAAVERIAGQAARAILNTRRLRDAETIAKEAQDSLAHLAGQLREQNNAGARALKSGWENYLQKHDAVMGYDININGRQTLTRAADISPTLREAMAGGQLVTTDAPEGTIINIPILIRGELLGAMSFQLPEGRALTERQIELARSVAERLGTTLDNARLFEQGQSQVQRERQANEVASRLLGVTDVQTVLDLAAADFQTALGAVYTQVYVSGVQDEPRNKRETSS